MSDEQDLEMLLVSHFPITTIETHEEQRALNLLKRVVARSKRALYTWSVTEGLRYQLGDSLDFSIQGDAPSYGAIEYPIKEPKLVLQKIKETIKNTVVVLLDFHPYLDDPFVIRLLKEIAIDYSVTQNTMVLLSHAIAPPPELARLTASYVLSLPDAKKLEQLIHEEAKLWALKNENKKLKADKRAMQLMIRDLQGLTVSDARRLIRNAIYHDGAITEDDLPAVMKAKYELLGQDGVLSFEYDTAKFADIGGFRKLMDWIQKRRAAFMRETVSHLDVPKGVMLLGVQGGGKSLAAKVIAGVWEVPLLRMDFGALYNKFFGETEKNIRESLKTAELMSPCVLWMDEIEKGIATGDSDNGTSRRVLASLLTWMAENTKPVFVVATANDISALPPELLRKGRMDEIFFVDLPDATVRREIFMIHLKRRGQDPDAFDLSQLVAASVGFSGAEIEQSVVAALYSAYPQSGKVNTAEIVAELKATQPLSVVMSEKIQALQDWSVGRTVSVN